MDNKKFTINLVEIDGIKYDVNGKKIDFEKSSNLINDDKKIVSGNFLLPLQFYFILDD